MISEECYNPSKMVQMIFQDFLEGKKIIQIYSHKREVPVDVIHLPLKIRRGVHDPERRELKLESSKTRD